MSRLHALQGTQQIPLSSKEDITQLHRSALHSMQLSAPAADSVLVPEAAKVHIWQPPTSPKSMLDSPEFGQLGEAHNQLVQTDLDHISALTHHSDTRHHSDSRHHSDACPVTTSRDGQDSQQICSNYADWLTPSSDREVLQDSPVINLPQAASNSSLTVSSQPVEMVVTRYNIFDATHFSLTTILGLVMCSADEVPGLCSSCSRFRLDKDKILLEQSRGTFTSIFIVMHLIPEAASPCCLSGKLAAFSAPIKEN